MQRREHAGVFVASDASPLGLNRLWQASRVDFFEPPPRRPAPPQPPRYRRPEWSGPPENVAPGVAALDLVLVNTGELAIFVKGARVYPTGFEMTLTLLFREEPGIEDPIGMRPFRHARRGLPEGEIPSERLRFGLRFSDGRKATNIDGPAPWSRDDSRPDGAVLVARGGSGGERRWEQRLWAWPLPPPGELLFACEWPAQELALTTATLDAQVILSAAGRACVLWAEPDLPERPAPGQEG
jgi:hypothetical protein